MPENEAGETAADAAVSTASGDEVGQGEQQEQQQQQQQQQQQEGFSFAAITKTLLVRCMIIYFITSFLRPSPQNPSQKDGPAVQQRPATNVMLNGTFMDFYAYVSEDRYFSDFDDEASLIWKKEGLIYGDWYSGPDGDGTYKHSTTLIASDKLLNNGSIYMHIYIVESGRSPNPKAGKDRYHAASTIYRLRQLNKYKKLRYTKTHNLLTGQTAADPHLVKKAEIMKEEIVSHWHPNITINIVNDFTPWTPGHLPPPMDEYIEFSSTYDHYKPILFVNDYWNLLREYHPINSSTRLLNLTMVYQPLSLWKWQLYSAQSMRNKWSSSFFTGDDDDEDQDSLKEALLETSPYLLGLTIIISIVHSVFEFLAFKNDIQFWNSRQSLEGLSVRSVFFNVIQSFIVMLYVFDNDTNFMVKISCFIGLFIEFWKINKVVDIRLEYAYGIVPYPAFTDKGSYVQSSTKQYDQLAFRYLSWLLFPLMACYSIYSLLYLEHKGFYSWVLGMLYGFLLTFGFIMMTPQLFINYKMKSVAHLPWRMLTYKFLNTFIDDIFAFVIKMPTMYRIGCFRDDIVFIIFLYQRYVYSVDPSRMNEFGFSQVMEEEAKQKGVAQNGEVKGAEEKKKD